MAGPEKVDGIIVFSLKAFLLRYSWIQCATIKFARNFTRAFFICVCYCWKQGNTVLLKLVAANVRDICCFALFKFPVDCIQFSQHAFWYCASVKFLFFLHDATFDSATIRFIVHIPRYSVSVPQFPIDIVFRTICLCHRFNAGYHYQCGEL